MKHHTKEKGDTGTAEVIADLLRRGISICLPLSEHLPFDLIGVKQDASLIRISVKYRAAVNGIISVPFRSCYSDSNGCHTKKVDKSLIDLLAIYCPNTDKVYYVNPNDFGTYVTLRLVPTKNNQTKGVFLADNYLTL